MRNLVVRMVVPLLAAWSVPARADDIDALAPGHWRTIPGTKLAAVAPSPLPPGYHAAVTSAWSGGAYDTKRNRLLVTGGGHADYAGNEVYAFDMFALTWSRLVDPTPNGQINASGAVEAYGDGKPSSRHTYSGLSYDPNTDALYMIGGARWVSGSSTKAVWRLDLTTKTWTRKTDTPEGKDFFGSPTSFDPVTGKLVFRGSDCFAEYAPAMDTWTKKAENGAGWWQANISSALDPDRRLLVVLGAGELIVYDIAAGTYKTQATTGGSAVIQANAPGFAFDPASKKFVAWIGGGDVYSLDPSTWIWTKHASMGGTAPGAPEQNGTYGRFRYVPARNVFVLVSSVDEDVAVFRFAPGTGTGPTPPDPPPSGGDASTPSSSSGGSSSTPDAGSPDGNYAAPSAASAGTDGGAATSSCTLGRSSFGSVVLLPALLAILGAILARRRASS